MGNGRSKPCEKSPLGCILKHWSDIVGHGGTENRRKLIKYCNQWWPLYKLESDAKWPQEGGTLDYNTLLQLMLFLRREGKWDEVSYADMFFVLRDKPEWQKDCGLVPPRDPMVLALEREDRRERKGKLKRCCSACSIGQRCIKLNGEQEPELNDLFNPPYRVERQGSAGAPSPPPGEQEEEIPQVIYKESQTPAATQGNTKTAITAPNSPVSSRTRQKSVLQAPLREAVNPDGGTMKIKVPFTGADLREWKEAAREYRNDPIKTAQNFKFLIKQHNPDWSDIQLLLDCLTETEKQLVIKTAGDLAKEHYNIKGDNYREWFPLLDPEWDPNRAAEMGRLQAYQEWIFRGMEKAIPRTINWAALYEVRQGPSETPSEFLDRIRDAMRRHTSLDPNSEVGAQQLISLFLGQSQGDIRRKLQKLRPPENRDLEKLVEEAWGIFSNREEGYKQDQKKILAVVRENENQKSKVKSRRGLTPLGRNQCAICKRTGHWKNECPERRHQENTKWRSNQGKTIAHMEEEN